MKIIYQNFLINNFEKFINTLLNNHNINDIKYIYFNAFNLNDIKMSLIQYNQIGQFELSIINHIESSHKCLLNKDHLIFNSPPLSKLIFSHQFYIIFDVDENTYVIRVKQLSNKQIEMDTFIDKIIDYDDGEIIINNKINKINEQINSKFNNDNDDFSISLSSSDSISSSNNDITLEPTWKVQKTLFGQQYIKLLRDALDNHELFINFRNHVGFKNIAISYDKCCNQYYNYFKINKSHIFDNPIFKEIQLLDKIGNINIEQNSEINENSLSALYWRYLYVAYQILDKWTNIKNIIEIGNGIGGLAAVLLTINHNLHITLIDLPIINEFSKKYIPKKLHKNIRWMNNNNIIIQKYDLLISEFTLSELSNETYQYYHNNIIQYCKSAYLAMNFWNPDEKNTNLLSLKTIYNNIIEKEEFPKTDYNNYNLYCN